ncbi:hypothetical protein UFOVP1476_23 [uncultured Caudovirales phage]|uniref:Uncharacterized protein n=1 Tax=uncultured Caudovirales phage TaxID=2100421 RepID=A0A6J5SNW5_9CAUD|nr:hypothetical protein UFOVP944_23 [uncultured Caudovirales phage]CAB4203384.1 hypothetical protein UFOVP1381_50 [uncultured Caudovirales phage]CAB4216023.1 hypothetical protein UFOVP1476_23 [uncultured Caudovirales phage]
MIVEQLCRSCDRVGGIEVNDRRSPGPLWSLFSSPSSPSASCRYCGVEGETAEEIAETIEIDDAILSRDLG